MSTEPDRHGPRKLLTDREVAERYGVSERTVRTWREKGAVATVRTPSGRPRTLDPEPTESR